MAVPRKKRGRTWSRGEVLQVLGLSLQVLGIAFLLTRLKRSK